MNIGDKVRHLFGTEEGVVIKFLSKGQVEVEIEDGFRIPFMQQQLVVVEAAEGEAFQRDEPKQSSNQKGKSQQKGKVQAPAIQPYAIQGIFLGFIHRNDKELELILINNTDLDVLFTLGEELDRNYEDISMGSLKPKSYQKVHEMNLNRFERWPALVLQALRFKRGARSLQEPLVKKMRWKASTFHKHKQEVPLMGKEGYVFQFDVEIKPMDMSKLKNTLEERLMSGTSSENSVMASVGKRDISPEVDLHIEALTPYPDQMSNSDIIELQLKCFEDSLDQAILGGLNEITFIHGVGSGKLRSEIQKLLSKHPNVAFFKDARKERFGYGATTVSIK